ncbi:right-handed parallel beta-helix repeat-containing protein [Desulfatiferula olefinivorans]
MIFQKSLIAIGLVQALIFLFSTVCFPASGERVFYVSLQGNDDWSGGFPDPETGKNDGPFETLERARRAVMEARAAEPEQSITVRVRGGRYERSEPFFLGTEDSGLPQKPVKYEAFEAEIPVLSVARSITGFVPHARGIMKANLGGPVLSEKSAAHLFVHGQRRPLARYPNQDSMNPRYGGFLHVRKGAKGKAVFPRESSRPWRSLSEARMVLFPGHNWTNNILKGLEWDRTTNTIRPLTPPTHDILSGNRFYVENLFEELDAPGEWYVDRNAGILYVIPVTPEDVSAVTLSWAENVIGIIGHSEGLPVSDIEISGFVFEGSSGHGVLISDGNRITVSGNTVRGVGSCGIVIDRGRDNRVTGNHIYDVGHTGVTVKGGNPVNLTASGHRVDNNDIHHTGMIHKGGASGILCKGVGHIIVHNRVSTTPRVGIWFSGNDHLIEYNVVCDTNLETQDSGMIYSSQIDWTARGTKIRYNYLKNSGGYGRRSSFDSFQTSFVTYGVYLDDWTSGTEVFGNIIVNTVSGGVLIHGGRDNIIENNIIYNGGRRGQVILSAWPPDHSVSRKWVPKMYGTLLEKKSGVYVKKYPAISSIQSPRSGSAMTGNRFIRNIVVLTEPDAVVFDVPHPMDFKGTVSDANTVFCGSGSLGVRLPSKLFPSNWSLWKSMGFDRTSHEADPLLVDPVNGDFGIHPDSPALKLGFIPIPLDRIGIVDTQGRTRTDCTPERCGNLRRPPRLEPMTIVPGLPGTQGGATP